MKLLDSCSELNTNDVVLGVHPCFIILLLLILLPLLLSSLIFLLTSRPLNNCQTTEVGYAQDDAQSATFATCAIAAALGFLYNKL